MLCSALGSLGLTLASDPIQLFLARSATGVAGAGWVAIRLLFASQFQNKLKHYAISFMMVINGKSITI